MHSTVEDILHLQSSDPGTRWSRVNAAEQFPGIMSTFTWDVWRRTADRAGRRIFFEMGLLRRDEIDVTAEPHHRFIAAWHGRQSANVDVMRAIIDRFPGNAGDSFEEQILGAAPAPGSVSRAPKRVLAVLRKMPGAFLSSRKDLERTIADVAAWHGVWIARIANEGATAGRAAIAELVERLPEIQTRLGLAAFVQQALFGALQNMLPPEKRGLMLRSASGEGLPETRFADAVWAAANGERSRADVIAEFGHFGIDSADCAKPSLRHKPEMLDDMMRLYRGGEKPSAALAATRTRRATMERELLSDIALLKRPAARWLLRACDRMAHSREMGRAGWVQALDVGRAAAFAIGTEMTKSGNLRAPEDAYHLTIAELLAVVPADVDVATAYRKALHEWRESFDLPVAFTGEPEILQRHHHAAAAQAASNGPLQGVAGSAGIGRGRARVVFDPFHIKDFTRGDILVCRITDPNWTPLMALAGGVVTDIGGSLSHGAIIARELGIPAVLNTKDGTLRIKDGACIEIDGSTGAIRVLQENAEADQ